MKPVVVADTSARFRPTRPRSPTRAADRPRLAPESPNYPNQSYNNNVIMLLNNNNKQHRHNNNNNNNNNIIITTRRYNIPRRIAQMIDETARRGDDDIGHRT
jgi:hypothetical protein